MFVFNQSSLDCAPQLDVEVGGVFVMAIGMRRTLVNTVGEPNPSKTVHPHVLLTDDHVGEGFARIAGHRLPATSSFTVGVLEENQNALHMPWLPS
jgi:hypothetical protein